MGVIYWAWWGGIKMGDSTLHRMGEELPKIAFCRKKCVSESGPTPMQDILSLNAACFGQIPNVLVKHGGTIVISTVTVFFSI